MRFSWQLLRKKPDGLEVLSHGASPTLRASFAAIIGEGRVLERSEDVRCLWFEVRDAEQAAAEGDLVSLPTDPSMLTDQFMGQWGGGHGR